MIPDQTHLPEDGRDLTTIVEKVARDVNDAWAVSPGTHGDLWEALGPMDRHRVRELVLPIVTATLRAIDEVTP